MTTFFVQNDKVFTKKLENPGLNNSLLIKSQKSSKIVGHHLCTFPCSNYFGNVSEKNGTIKPKWPKAHNGRKYEARYKCFQIFTLLKTI